MQSWVVLVAANFPPDRKVSPWVAPHVTRWRQQSDGLDGRRGAGVPGATHVALSASSYPSDLTGPRGAQLPARDGHFAYLGNPGRTDVVSPDGRPVVYDGAERDSSEVRGCVPGSSWPGDGNRTTCWKKKMTTGLPELVDIALRTTGGVAGKATQLRFRHLGPDR